MERRRLLPWMALTVAILIVGLAAGTVVAAGACKQVKGKLTLQTVSGAGCDSPIDQCATGTYTGGLSGISTFVGTSFLPTADTPTTSVAIVLGDNVITTERGVLRTKDAIVLQTSGAGNFAEVDTVVGGTGSLAGVTGTIKATGFFGPSGGTGTYEGELCRP